MLQNLSVCVIGAGAAGLCAIKHGLDNGLEVIAFEITKEIGRTWVYSDDIGKDKYGNNIHTSMYKGLVTNTPKEIMGFPNLPFSDQENSYITSGDVRSYYHWYADKFDLLKHINFEHNVLRVRPLEDKSWEVIVLDLPQQLPKQLHSHDFRNADDFKGERVCIVGAGPSAMEMVTLISKVANVTWSHHSKRPFTHSIIKQRPDIHLISEENVTFIDGTTQSFSSIIYATGYLYTFPFLSVDCGLFVIDNEIQPLYKYCISVRSRLSDYYSRLHYKLCYGVVMVKVGKCSRALARELLANRDLNRAIT